ncbi:glycosyltransferase family 4 protein [Cetobacterium sp.]|uniref:glycosyltransferase family 4 protein n=1 Tax=Cetobacterium sp. TaxID=2071632 RepID=UPI003F2A3435
MQKIMLIFDNIEQVHLGKDVFLVPYYIAKEFNKELIILTGKNRTGVSEYRGIKIIEKRSKLPLFKEMGIYFYMILNSKKIDRLILFHLGIKPSLKANLYKILNPNGKIYVKLDLNLEGLIKSQKYKFNNIKEKIYYQIIKKFLKNVDLFSSETKEIYSKIFENGLYGIKIKEKIEYLPNGFDDVLLEKLNMKINAFEIKEKIMITVGRIGAYEKNTEMLLEALNGIDLKNWKILIIGPFDEKFKNKFKNFLSKNEEKIESVLLIGNISDKKKLYEYYNKSKVFILTSRWEGSALVYPEALRFGNYILTTDVGGAKDITNDSEIGKIIAVDDINALRKEIKKIVEEKINLEIKYNKSLKLSDEHFLWSNIIKNSKKVKSIFN